MRAVAPLTLAFVLGAACDGDSTSSAATCSDKGGTVCTATEDCDGSWIQAADTDRCCSSSCVYADYSHDADGFLWGTEADLKLEDHADMPADVENNVEVVRNVLRTTYVKIRLGQPDVASYSADNFCSIIPDAVAGPTRQCHNLNETVRIYQDNGWSMIPMLQPRKLRSQNETMEQHIASYVDFVDWFVTTFKDEANIQYLELVNAPFQSWEGSDEELLKLNNAVYERLKPKFADLLIGTPGFEYFRDTADIMSNPQVTQIEHFLNNDAQFDFWAFHGYRTLARPTEYPPTASPLHNPYAGVSGILTIAKALVSKGWGDRPIVDTEYTALYPEWERTDDNERLAAAFIVQDMLLKRTLMLNGTRVLTGVLPLKIQPCTADGRCQWASLRADGSPTRSVQATGLLWSKLKHYHYHSHLSGEFDDETQVWIEKFVADDGELFVFFKPFEFRPGERFRFDGQTVAYDLEFATKPVTATLTDTRGNSETLSPTQTITLDAENEPKYLEVGYGN